ncbi:MAG: low molecular weight protein-tyrosine-phosphatase [Phycisphaerales bacterium]
MTGGDGGAERTGVLFVCLGNICRSPLAEGVFIHRARERGVLDRFEVDSCGTGAWHVGECADHRSIAVARRHGIELPSIARQVCPADFGRFDWLIAMDRANVHTLSRAGAPAERVRLMRSFDPVMMHRPVHELDVPDPYDWPGDGFEEVFQMLDAACAGLLEYLVED